MNSGLALKNINSFVNAIKYAEVMSPTISFKPFISPSKMAKRNVRSDTTAAAKPANGG